MSLEVLVFMQLVLFLDLLILFLEIKLLLLDLDLDLELLWALRCWSIHCVWYSTVWRTNPITVYPYTTSTIASVRMNSPAPEPPQRPSPCALATTVVIDNTTSTANKMVSVIFNLLTFFSTFNSLLSCQIWYNLNPGIKQFVEIRGLF